MALAKEADPCAGRLESVDPAKGRSRFIAMVVRANVVAPQINLVIAMTAFSQYILNPFAPDLLLASPSDKELQRVGEAMNHAHGDSGIPVYMENSAQAFSETGSALISPDRLRDLLTTESEGVAIAMFFVAHTLLSSDKTWSPPSEPLTLSRSEAAAYVQQVMFGSSVEQKGELRFLAKSLDQFVRSENVKTILADYKARIKAKVAKWRAAHPGQAYDLNSEDFADFVRFQRQILRLKMVQAFYQMIDSEWPEKDRAFGRSLFNVLDGQTLMAHVTVQTH
jgi:hypothetical protein